MSESSDNKEIIEEPPVEPYLTCSSSLDSSSENTGRSGNSASPPAIVLSLPSEDENRGVIDAPPPAVQTFRRWSSPDLQRLFLDCNEVIRRARSLTERIDKCVRVKNLVRNLPDIKICQIYEKIYTSWATLYSSAKSSDGTSEEISLISTDDPHEVFPCDLPHRQTTTSVAPTWTILTLVRNELEKLRNLGSVQVEPADVAVLIPLSRNEEQFRTPSPMQESMKAPSAEGSCSPTEDISDPLELLLRLISFNERELMQYQEKIEKARYFLRSNSKRPMIAITCPSPEKKVKYITEPGPPHVDLLQKFRDCLVQEAQKLSDRLVSEISKIGGSKMGETIRAEETGCKPDIEMEVAEGGDMESAGATSCKPEIEMQTTERDILVQPLTESGHIFSLSTHIDAETEGLKEAQRPVVLQHHLTVRRRSLSKDASNLRSTGPHETDGIDVSSGDETGRSVSSLPWDDTSPTASSSVWDSQDQDRSMETEF